MVNRIKMDSRELSNRLNDDLVSYVDDVDNGRVEERPDVPCFSRMINLFNASANTLEEFDQQFPARPSRNWNGEGTRSTV